LGAKNTISDPQQSIFTTTHRTILIPEQAGSTNADFQRRNINMTKHSRLPKYNELLNPLFQAVHDQIAANRGFDRFFNHIYSLCKM